MTPPKLFISYSWSTPEHEQLVLNLATELRESGVDVILDKWDLREGHDSIAFMEQMVNNSEIKKVAIICDELYASKADGRAGGVGTETQIISKEVYDNQAQEKFVAVITSKSENGKPYLPTYYKSRIYIDLSSADRYADNFEQLLRWIFDKPLFVKPEIGNRPSFLSEGEHLTLGTTALFKRCVDAIKNDKAYAAGALHEYCRLFSSNFERFRLPKSDGEFDDALVKNLDEFLPHRNEAIQLFTTIAEYAPTTEFIQRIFRFLEDLIPYRDRPANITSWSNRDFDNFKFLVHELFLYALSILIKYERFDQANTLIQQQYYVPGNLDNGKKVSTNFSIFRTHLESLEYRNERLKLRRLSLHSDLLKERCIGTGLEFRHLMQADFVAFMRSDIDMKNEFDWSQRWFPETLLYLNSFNSPFEIFARSISKSYFDRVKILLNIEKPIELEQLLTAYQGNSSFRLPQWGHHSFNPGALLGYNNLATKP
ncbi:SEFIR domain-containing protein [Collimonas sp. OK412]|jgi:hypothetical protein|uniref:SEFIR domain-containing protein n=1 Tax=Collimonas sp. (strain OK412) TaxID=1801619 RepID=UPI0008F23019|nr:SEFIR domain-containing protein [Collimonas sp. OK412]SFB68948.1 SEFIR domain-containing protein [Collimonas sp. OK412]